MVLVRTLALLSVALIGAGAGIAQTALPVGQTLPAPAEKAVPPEAGQPAANTSAVPFARPQRQLSPLQRGDILMARKMYREAIETYREGTRNIAVLYNKIGIGYHQLMDFKTALENYNTALRFNPTYAEAINNIGAVYYAKKNYKRAIKDYKKALKYSPKSASIYSNLGTAYFARKKYKDASENYQMALAIDPDVFEHRSTAGSLLQERSVEERAKFHFYVAKTYARAGMVERALNYMRKALEEGFRDKDKFRKDPDFKELQENEEFQALLAMKPRVL